ncbi:MAG: hypothetical protein ACYTXE_39345 [Nostoc sp.]
MLNRPFEPPKHPTNGEHSDFGNGSEPNRNAGFYKHPGSMPNSPYFLNILLGSTTNGLSTIS